MDTVTQEFEDLNEKTKDFFPVHSNHFFVEKMNKRRLEKRVGEMNTRIAAQLISNSDILRSSTGWSPCPLSSYVADVIIPTLTEKKSKAKDTIPLSPSVESVVQFEETTASVSHSPFHYTDDEDEDTEKSYAFDSHYKEQLLKRKTDLFQFADCFSSDSRERMATFKQPSFALKYRHPFHGMKLGNLFSSFSYSPFMSSLSVSSDGNQTESDKGNSNNEPSKESGGSSEQEGGHSDNNEDPDDKNEDPDNTGNGGEGNKNDDQKATSDTEVEEPKPTLAFTMIVDDFYGKANSTANTPQVSDLFGDETTGHWRLLVYPRSHRGGEQWCSAYLAAAVDVDNLGHGWWKKVDFSITAIHPKDPSFSIYEDGDLADYDDEDAPPPPEAEVEDFLQTSTPEAETAQAVLTKSDDAAAKSVCAIDKDKSEFEKEKNDDDLQVSSSDTNDLSNTSITRKGTNTFKGKGATLAHNFEWGYNDLVKLDVLLKEGFLSNEGKLAFKVELTIIEAKQGLAFSNLSKQELEDDLIWAVGVAAVPMVKQCLLHGADPSHVYRVKKKTETPLHKASCTPGWRPGAVEVVCILIDQPGVDVNECNSLGETPLLLAADVSGCADICRILLLRGADPTIRTDNGWSPFNCAAKRGRNEIIDLLVTFNCPIEELIPEYSALLHAAAQGHVDTIKLLLSYGIEVNVCDKHGDTALWKLVDKDMAEIALLMSQEYHASVARCSRDRKKVTKARLILKHAEKKKQVREQEVVDQARKRGVDTTLLYNNYGEEFGDVLSLTNSKERNKDGNKSPSFLSKKKQSDILMEQLVAEEDAAIKTDEKKKLKKKLKKDRAKIKKSALKTLNLLGNDAAAVASNGNGAEKVSINNEKETISDDDNIDGSEDEDILMTIIEQKQKKKSKLTSKKTASKKDAVQNQKQLKATSFLQSSSSKVKPLQANVMRFEEPNEGGLKSARNEHIISISTSSSSVTMKMMKMNMKQQAHDTSLDSMIPEEGNLGKKVVINHEKNVEKKKGDSKAVVIPTLNPSSISLTKAMTQTKELIGDSHVKNDEQSRIDPNDTSFKARLVIGHSNSSKPPSVLKTFPAQKNTNLSSEKVMLRSPPKIVAEDETGMWLDCEWGDLEKDILSLTAFED